ncbi:MAG: DNA polymerase/3'-5' exonuclease PolX [Sedimentisphaerales bacterium]|nr:DNA polymerase/3'-5' exonuclease PolX [Sedimentisphaerales bacterium]
MSNAILSELFGQMAEVMEILGEDRFRVNTYRKVSRIIGDIPVEVGMLLESGRLAETPGIGKSSLAKIEEFIKTGSITAHRELLAKIPGSLLDLLKIPGMGPKGVKAVYEKLKVTSIPELKEVIATGALAKLPGFGEKKAAAILRGIDFLEKSTGRIRLDQAAEAAEIVVASVRCLSEDLTIRSAGSLRRRRDTIGDVDILVGCGQGGQASGGVVEAFTKGPNVKEILASGATKGSAIIETSTCDVQVDVRAVGLESFASAWQYFTGSQAHNVRLREIAAKAGLKLNEYGLFKGEKAIPVGSERDIYEELGLVYIAPVLREDRGEIEAAKSGALPVLVEFAEIKGDLHMHTVASDGDCSIEALAEAAAEMGYEYICITDHSHSSAIAGGLSAGQLARQIKQIRKLNDKTGCITILAGSEVDILADGSMDFENELLAELDFVIASIHSGLAGDRSRVTMRTLKAMDNPYVNCIGHPSGRLIGRREAMDIDMAAVIDHAAQTHTALEVNANPWRLDLKDTHCRTAIEAGVKLAIGTDAHSTAGLGLMGFGVATAARGWARQDDVLNCLGAAKLKAFVKKKRQSL